MAYVTSLRSYQAGIQSAFGTAVAATAKLAVEELLFRTPSVMHQPNIAKGLAVSGVGDAFPTRHITEWVARGPVNYDQLQLWLLAALDGTVTASGGDPYTWTFTKNATSLYTPKYLTLEVRHSDGSTPDDFEVADCVVTSIRLTKGADERIDMEITGIGRKVQDSTLTGSLSQPTREHMPFAKSTVDIDSTWAGLGTTNLAAQVLDWSWELVTGLFPVYTADGRSDLDYAAIGYDPGRVALNFNATLRGTAQFATEKAAARAATLRAVQVVVSGTQSRALTLNGLFRHAAADIQEMGSQDGEDVFAINLVKSSDETNFMSVVLVNKTNADDGVA